MPGPGLTHETAAPGAGSVIVVVATDVPLLPHQLKRLARRVPLALARLGGAGEHGSGDIFIAFSTANSNAGEQQAVQSLEMLPSDTMTPPFDATVQATEEAVLNALVAARTMTGINGNTAHALPHDRLQEVLRKYGRLRPAEPDSINEASY
jgi:L-aminopeptidase/D-esterase-like protein